MTACAFVGLGVMGYPMAGHLVAAGHDVVVHNRSPGKARRWVDEHGGRAAGSPAEAVSGAELVFVCVGADDDVREVVTGPDGALSGMVADAVLVDHTTASPSLAVELDAAAGAIGAGFVDAPVSGGESGAVNGTLTVMCGGAPDAFARAQPAMGAYARAATLLGPAGSGQSTKMVNQVAIAGLLQGLSEGLELGRRAGLDLDRVIDVISQGAAGSWQMDNRARTMWRDEFDFGFAVDWMRKDLAICLGEAGRLGLEMPVAALVATFYDELSAAGMGRADTSALIHRLGDPDTR